MELGGGDDVRANDVSLTDEGKLRLGSLNIMRWNLPKLVKWTTKCVQDATKITGDEEICVLAVNLHGESGEDGGDVGDSDSDDNDVEDGDVDFFLLP
jgi:hypothetical protein